MLRAYLVSVHGDAVLAGEVSKMQRD